MKLGKASIFRQRQIVNNKDLKVLTVFSKAFLLQFFSPIHKLTSHIGNNTKNKHMSGFKRSE